MTNAAASAQNSALLLLVPRTASIDVAKIDEEKIVTGITYCGYYCKCLLFTGETLGNVQAVI